MERKRSVSSLLEPKMQIYFVWLLMFSLVTMAFQVYIGAAELLLVIGLYIGYRHSRKLRQEEVAKYIQTASFSIDTATKDTMLNAPLPMVIFQPDRDEIVWSNEPFHNMTGQRERAFDAKLSATVPGFQYQWLLDGKRECPEEVEVNDRRYQVFGHMVRTDENTGPDILLATTYWVDITELAQTRDAFTNSRPVAAIITLDNYEELFKGISENAKSSILAEIGDKISAWVGQAEGLLCMPDRDRYLFICQEQEAVKLIEKKFTVLEEVRKIVSPNRITASLAIGVGRDAGTYAELFQFANLALEMALSRGGDQAVIKNRFTFEFFGGKGKETEKRTKVKSRVMSSALGELIGGASHVFVMGHKFPDLDCSGAAAGICAIARKKGVPAYMILERTPAPWEVVLRRLAVAPEYQSAFITVQDAMVMADTNSVLVVVDTNRPEKVQSEELLASCTKVAVIDHHRRAATYIANAALNFHEPSASSASELVSELLTYLLDEPTDLLPVEAEALMAGIVLDTKNFTMRTGSRTFEAAAYLRRAGADTAEVKKLFQNDLSGTVARYAIIQEAQMYRNTIAIATVTGRANRVIVAQAADELLNVSGVEASFVLFEEEGRAIISGRSMGDINVQVVLETLGGGGNAMIAGAQMENTPLEEAKEQLIGAIDRYFEE
jgi:c-di-AMP phosphodiesterase-like protein